MKDMKFHTPNCQECSNCKRTGFLDSTTYYCTAGKKTRRLPKAGIKRKVAEWCPRLISPPRCRIFGFISEEESTLDFMVHHDDGGIINGLGFPTASRYKVRCTYPLGMTAKQFAAALEEEPLYDIFPDADLSAGEVIEIDDGLKAYYFYYSYKGKIVPAHFLGVENIV